MITKILDQSLVYTGEQLKPLYNYLEQGLLGDSMVAWVGPCNVDPRHMLDGEDLRAKSEIRGERMVHLILELFDFDLYGMVGVQRLASELLLDTLEELCPKRPWGTSERRGDDLYLDHRKLNISVAISGPRSSLMHYAFNVVNEGTPIQTACLEEFGLAPDIVLKHWLPSLEAEIASIRRATWKVRF